MAAPDSVRSRHTKTHQFFRPERDEDRPLERLDDEPELERTPDERDELPLDLRTVPEDLDELPLELRTPDERDELPLDLRTLPEEREELPEDRPTDVPRLDEPVDRPMPDVRERVLALRPTEDPLRLVVRDGTAREPVELDVARVRVVVVP